MLSGPAANNREGAWLGTGARALVPGKSAFTHLLFTPVQYQLYSLLEPSPCPHVSVPP